MPGEISRSNPGTNSNCPYVPSWCYKDSNPPICSCGHHIGYHSGDGICNQRHKCKCIKYDGKEIEDY